MHLFSRFLGPTLWCYIQPSAVITRSNIVRYYMNNYRNWGRISIRCLIQKYITYLDLTGEIWVVFCEYLWENWPHYNGTALYFSIQKRRGKGTQLAHDAIITSLWPQCDVATSFWRHNDVFASCLGTFYEWFLMLLFGRFVQIHFWFPQITATWDDVSSTHIGNRHWMFKAALIFSFLYYLKKKHTKKLYFHWTVDCS